MSWTELFFVEVGQSLLVVEDNDSNKNMTSLLGCD